MTIITRLAGIATVAIALSASAASTQVCMGGNIEQLNATQLHACQAQVQDVHVAAQKFGTPNWHFIVVCDEAGWQDYAAFSNTSEAVLRNASADTNAPMHTTFIRGSRLTGDNAQEVLAATMTDIVRQTKPVVEVASLR
jgi:hypothetical protein